MLCSRRNGCQRRLVVVYPLQLVAFVPDLRNQIAGDEVIILVVVHEQHLARAGFMQFRLPAVQPPRTSIGPAP